MTKLTAAILAAFAGAACFAPGAGADSPLRLVGSVSDGMRVQSDGVRFALTQLDVYEVPPRVFDTLRGRSFRPAPPAPGCIAPLFGGGRLGWVCPGSGVPLINNLATGVVREAAGWKAVEALEDEYTPCGPVAIGRYWVQVGCGQGSCCEQEPRYLNHRTGALVGPLRRPAYADLDYAGLKRPVCAPLSAKELVEGSDAYAPPFALEVDWPGFASEITAIRLRKCGRHRAVTLSRCRFGCVTPQLGSRYATWGDGDSVVAYLPRTRQRMRLGRPAEAFDWLRLVAVAHTCNRVFAQWGDRVFVARVKFRRGAPRCPRRAP